METGSLSEIHSSHEKNSHLSTSSTPFEIGQMIEPRKVNSEEYL
jgi:hypothetical protein